jgi:hypothetical protein
MIISQEILLSKSHTVMTPKTLSFCFDQMHAVSSIYTLLHSGIKTRFFLCKFLSLEDLNDEVPRWSGRVLRAAELEQSWRCSMKKWISLFWCG